MGSQKQARLAEIARFAGQTIGEAEFASLLNLLTPIRDDELRHLLRESGLALTPVVEGVRQEDFDQLERTLIALSAEYESSETGRARTIRRLVITARTHAKFAAGSAKQAGHREMKREMSEWMLVWLENPGIFPQWIRLKRRAQTI